MRFGKMKTSRHLSIRTILLSLAYTAITANGVTPDCVDAIGKFNLPSTFEYRNCSYIRNKKPELCENWKVKTQCPVTCGQCNDGSDIVAIQGANNNDANDEHDEHDEHDGHDDHGHDHTDEHLKMACDTSDELFIEHIDEIETFCAGIIGNYSGVCPYKCLQPMQVMKLYYEQTCPGMTKNKSFALVEILGVCDLDDPHHPPPAELADQQDGIEILPVSCADTVGRFMIPGVGKKHCAYIRNQDPDLCDSSWKVRTKCPATCGKCGDNHEEVHGQDASTDHKNDHHDHDHTDEHLLMACDVSDDLYVEHIEELEEYCADVIKGNDNVCPYKCLQPMQVMQLYYSDVCPGMQKDQTYVQVENAGLCNSDDPHHPPEIEGGNAQNGDEECADALGKFRLPASFEHRNCSYVRKQKPELCELWKVKTQCPMTCGRCKKSSEADVIIGGADSGSDSHDDHDGEDEHDGHDDHGHDHTDEHLKMACDTSDELFIEHIDEIETFCAGIIGNYAMVCPYKCLQPMQVMKLYYEQTCPGLYKHTSVSYVETSGVCDLDDPHHPPSDNQEDGLDVSCVDTPGKFAIPDAGNRNCAYVRNKDPDLCDSSWKVRTKCPMTCGNCEGSHEDDHDNDHNDHDGEDEHDGHDDHGHDHTDEHLKMACDTSDELFIEHIDEIETFCAGIIGNYSKVCPYKCLQPMQVMKLYYEQTCPGLYTHTSVSYVETSGVCDLDDPHHPPPADNQEDGLDVSCVDTPGKFAIPNAGNRNCAYVRNKDPDLCDSSWKVRTKCPMTCGNCEGSHKDDHDNDHNDHDGEDEHDGHDDHGHDHTDEHLKMACDTSDELFIEHIDEIETFCAGIIGNYAMVCPYKCLQPMQVMKLYYEQTCPGLYKHTSVSYVETSGVCDLDDHHHPPSDNQEDGLDVSCVDTPGKFAIPDAGNRNCAYVRNKDPDLCDSSWKVRTKCPMTCGNCEGSHKDDHDNDHNDHDGEDEHDGHDDHGHDHTDEHLKMACDTSDELFIEHIDEIETFCAGIIGNYAMVCPYKCLQPMQVMKLYYEQTCPGLYKHASVSYVETSGVCDLDDPHHPPPADNQEDGLDVSCVDTPGKFAIPDAGNRNCAYVRNKDPDLCDSSWKVRTKCPATCGKCGH